MSMHEVDIKRVVGEARTQAEQNVIEAWEQLSFDDLAAIVMEEEANQARRKAANKLSGYESWRND